MSLFDYLAQCGFWQWVGTILLIGIVAEGLGGLVRVTIGRKSK